MNEIRHPTTPPCATPVVVPSATVDTQGSWPLPPTAIETEQCYMMRQHGTSRGVSRWENRDLVIPLAITISHRRCPNYVGAATPRAQPMIAASLTEAAHDGWRPDEPTDFPTLFSRSQVRTKDTFFRWRVISVTIHLTRPIWMAPLVPHG